MELFDKRFVHFMWDDSLKGKGGFFSDEIHALVGYVESNTGVKRKASTISRGLKKEVLYDEFGASWALFYYDPLYEYKWAYKQGKTVKFEKALIWQQVTDEWDWDASCKYCIIEKEETSEQLLTNEQFSEWLARGNGVFRAAQGSKSRTVYNFREEHANDFIDSNIMVRRWCDTKWYTPTKGYCFPAMVDGEED